MTPQEKPQPTSKYAVLPPPVRREDLRTSQEVRPVPEPKSDHDRETEFLLRTTGLFLI